MTKVETKIVAYFDFDGTLTTGEMLGRYIRYVLGWRVFLLRLPIFLPALLLYLLKIINNAHVKQIFLKMMIQGVTKENLKARARTFIDDIVDKKINPLAFSKLEYHLEHGHDVILVSANLAIFLRCFAHKYGLKDVIATEIQFKSEPLLCTGRLLTKNCYGKVKVERICEYLSQNNIHYDYSYGYGNSKGDYELLNYVDEGYYIQGDEIMGWEDYRGNQSGVY
ncbi:MAG: HAD-IB family hydrolase [Bacteroidia bacterium]|nr:MAG: HAD-IB family hydrolase [Bacteroidia bacterium]